MSETSFDIRPAARKRMTRAGHESIDLTASVGKLNYNVDSAVRRLSVTQCDDALRCIAEAKTQARLVIHTMNRLEKDVHGLKQDIRNEQR